MNVSGPEGVRALIGQELPPSPWIEVTQERIDAFADCTDDHQWIHTDAARAGQSPYGTRIAHGYLTLSLLPHLFEQTLQVEGFRMTVNYGLNRVRFPAPVPAGSCLRARFTVKSVNDFGEGVQTVLDAVVEREGEAKPVCAAEIIFRFYE